MEKKGKESKVQLTSRRRNNGKECLVYWVTDLPLQGNFMKFDQEESPVQRINGTHRKVKVGPLIVHAIRALWHIKMIKKNAFHPHPWT